MHALNLTDEQWRRIERLRAERGLDTAEAVVAEGLDLLETALDEHDALRQALAEADADLAAGRVTSFPDGEALRAHFVSRIEDSRRSGGG